MGNFDIQEAVRRIEELPTLPSVLQQILATMAQPDASALDLSRHIAADQSLSAIVLKMVNSAYYGFYRQIKSVTQAIVILGFSEIRNLVLTATAFRSMPGMHAEDFRAQFWRHALAAAIAAERAALSAGAAREEAFVCGLLHDIGKVVLDSLYPEEYEQTRALAISRQTFIRETERGIFGIDHAEAGALLGDHWNLPGTIAEAIRCHHCPAEAVGDPAATHLTAIANFIAHQAGVGASGNAREPAIPAESFAFLRISEEASSAIIEDIRSNRERVEIILGALTG